MKNQPFLSQMTMIADTLHTMLAKYLRGFQDYDAQRIYRHFIKGKANITIEDKKVTVAYIKRTPNPILRALPWRRLPNALSWLEGVNLTLNLSCRIKNRSI